MNAPIDLDDDLPIKLSIYSLGFCGVMYILLGLAGPILMVSLFFIDDTTAAKEIAAVVVVSAILFVISVACGVGNFFVAWGLSRRKKWSWVAAVAVGALYAPSGCFMFGGLFLYAMLRSGVREAIEQAALEAG